MAQHGAHAVSRTRHRRPQTTGAKVARIALIVVLLVSFGGLAITRLMPAAVYTVSTPDIADPIPLTVAPPPELGTAIAADDDDRAAPAEGPPASGAPEAARPVDELPPPAPAAAPGTTTAPASAGSPAAGLAASLAGVRGAVEAAEDEADDIADAEELESAIAKARDEGFAAGRKAAEQSAQTTTMRKPSPTSTEEGDAASPAGATMAATVRMVMMPSCEPSPK